MHVGGSEEVEGEVFKGQKEEDHTSYLERISSKMAPV